MQHQPDYSTTVSFSTFSNVIELFCFYHFLSSFECKWSILMGDGRAIEYVLKYV